MTVHDYCLEDLPDLDSTQASRHGNAIASSDIQVISANKTPCVSPLLDINQLICFPFINNSYSLADIKTITINQ